MTSERLGPDLAELQRILAGLPVGVLIHDRDGVPFASNERADELLGDGTAVTTLVDDLVAQVGASNVDTADTYLTADLPAARALAGRATHVSDLEVGSGDDTRVLEVWGVPIRDDHGDVEFALTVYTDITERVEAERKLARAQAELERANEELLRSNLELEQFAYVASHDLSEPLRVVAGFVQLLARRYRDQLDDEANEFIDFTVDGVTRMQAMIQDLLDYSRVSHRGLDPKDVDCELVMADVLDELRSQIADAAAEVLVDELPIVPGDAGQLTQLLRNLVSNAVKFRRDDVTPIVAVSAEPAEGGGWRFSVDDNGIGIDPRHRERVFKMFQRLHQRGEYAGTGIGLAVCRKVVEHHGGTIWIEESPSGGTRVCFTLRAAVDDHEVL